MPGSRKKKKVKWREEERQSGEGKEEGEKRKENERKEEDGEGSWGMKVKMKRKMEEEVGRRKVLGGTLLPRGREYLALEVGSTLPSWVLHQVYLGSKAQKPPYCSRLALSALHTLTQHTT